MRYFFLAPVAHTHILLLVVVPAKIIAGSSEMQ